MTSIMADMFQRLGVSITNARGLNATPRRVCDLLIRIQIAYFCLLRSVETL